MEHGGRDLEEWMTGCINVLIGLTRSVGTLNGIFSRTTLLIVLTTFIDLY